MSLHVHNLTIEWLPYILYYYFTGAYLSKVFGVRPEYISLVKQQDSDVLLDYWRWLLLLLGLLVLLLLENCGIRKSLGKSSGCGVLTAFWPVYIKLDRGR